LWIFIGPLSGDRLCLLRSLRWDSPNVTFLLMDESLYILL